MYLLTSYKFNSRTKVQELDVQKHQVSEIAESEEVKETNPIKIDFRTIQDCFEDFKSAGNEVSQGLISKDYNDTNVYENSGKQFSKYKKY